MSRNQFVFVLPIYDKETLKNVAKHSRFRLFIHGNRNKLEHPLSEKPNDNDERVGGVRCRRTCDSLPPAGSMPRQPSSALTAVDDGYLMLAEEVIVNTKPKRPPNKVRECTRVGNNNVGIQNRQLSQTTRRATFIEHPAERVPPVAVLGQDGRVGEPASTVLDFHLPSRVVGPGVVLEQREVAVRSWFVTDDAKPMCREQCTVWFTPAGGGGGR